MYRVRTVFTGVAGTPWYSNLFFNPAPGNAPTSTHAAVVAFWQALAPEIYTAVTATVEGTVATIDEATGEITDVAGLPDTAIDCTNNFGPSGYANQGLITMRTGQYRFGRPVIGKVFVPGIGRGNYADNGNFLPSLATLMTTAANNLRTATSGGNLENWVVYARPRPIGFGQPVPVPGEAFTVTSSVGSTKVAVLRSRRD